VASSWTTVRLARGDATLVAIEIGDGRLQHPRTGHQRTRSSAACRWNRPRIVAAREPDGRWNRWRPDNAAIRTQSTHRSGPAIVISSIDINDGSVSLLDPLAFGAAHVPSRFEHLTTHFSFAYQQSPGRSTLLSVVLRYGAGSHGQRLSGAVSDGDEGWLFSKLHVVTPRSEFSLDCRRRPTPTPTALNLTVAAPRFAVPGVVRRPAWALQHRRRIGFRRAAVRAAAAMATKITLRSNGGDVSGISFSTTTVPGWHAKGAATVQRLDLARG
jgi:hypothetical protein